MHAALISFLTQSGNPDFVAAAGLLGSLKGLRTLADYDLNATVTMGQLRDVLEEADYLLTELLPSDAA